MKIDNQKHEMLIALYQEIQSLENHAKNLRELHARLFQDFVCQK